MTRTRSLALLLYLGTALAGAAIGITVDRMVLRPHQNWWDQGSMRDRLFKTLRLTAEQRVSVARVLDERNHKTDSLVAPIRAQLDSVSAEGRARLRALLTPAQQSIFDHLQREREQAQRTEKK